MVAARHTAILYAPLIPDRDMTHSKPRATRSASPAIASPRSAAASAYGSPSGWGRLRHTLTTVSARVNGRANAGAGGQSALRTTPGLRSVQVSRAVQTRSPDSSVMTTS